MQYYAGHYTGVVIQYRWAWTIRDSGILYIAIYCGLVVPTLHITILLHIHYPYAVIVPVPFRGLFDLQCLPHPSTVKGSRPAILMTTLLL